MESLLHNIFRELPRPSCFYKEDDKPEFSEQGFSRSFKGFRVSEYNED